jgi:DeoR family transcriptional regulator, fructose operon transcriptional repressor
MFAEERLLRIVAMVNKLGKATVAELSESLAVSSVTIRRDLERLDKDELLIRTHGGAMAMQNNKQEVNQEKSFSEKEEAFAAEKERIAAAASKLVNDGDAVLLTPGTTNMRLARMLIGKKELTLVTNAANIVTHIGSQSGIDIILTGGKLRNKSYAMVGPLADQALSGIRVDKLFLGIDGFDFNEGLTTPNLAEANTNRLMISIAKKVIVVADHSKFGKVTFSQIAPINVVHTIISDHMLPIDVADKIRELGI